MLSRLMDMIFIDFFALAINTTFGTLLRTKICNYSWEGEPRTEPKPDKINITELTEEELR